MVNLLSGLPLYNQIHCYFLLKKNDESFSGFFSTKYIGIFQILTFEILTKLTNDIISF